MAKVTSVSSLGWAHYTLYEALPRIANRGFQRIEIASFGSYSFHFNFGTPEPLELKKMLKCHGLRRVCLNFRGGPRFACKLDEVRQFIDVSRRKIKHCRPPYIGWSDETIKAFREWLKEDYPEFLFVDLRQA